MVTSRMRIPSSQVSPMRSRILRTTVPLALMMAIGCSGTVGSENGSSAAAALTGPVVTYTFRKVASYRHLAASALMTSRQGAFFMARDQGDREETDSIWDGTGLAALPNDAGFGVLGPRMFGPTGSGTMKSWAYDDAHETTYLLTLSGDWESLFTYDTTGWNQVFYTKYPGTPGQLAYDSKRGRILRVSSGFLPWQRNRRPAREVLRLSACCSLLRVG